MKTLERGVFTLSLDFELIWGTLDLFGTKGFGEACEQERVLVPRLLALFEKHGISATWCVLGHVMLDRCDGLHADIVRPRHSWHPGDWFQHDPGGDETAAPHFYGRTLVEAIQRCAVPQEIGCHSFSHVILGDPGCSRKTAETEIAASVQAAAALGITLRSFAFPRNSVGHLDVLARHGFTAFRGPGPRWYDKGGNADAQPLDRVGHLWDVVTAAEPPVVEPRAAEHGLVDIPGSMIFFPMHGARRFLPASRRVRRMRRGLEAAVRDTGVFHLWFHPTNLADEPESMFAALEEVLAEVARLRRQGVLEVCTMGELAA